jgi:hypothetical protein
VKKIILCLAVTVATLAAAGKDKYEVWVIDQSNSPGKAFGGTVYIWDGHDLEQKHRAATAPAERIDLGGAPASLCLATTGANPVRPHMIYFNADQTHAVISFVATGHVLIVEAATRTPVTCLRMSAGSGGAQQAHAAVPSPDQTYIAVANQNGKLLERIRTNYATNTFELEPAATLDLAGCTTPNGLPCQDPLLRPDNAPICPVVESSSRFTFVTLRGGGLFVVDAKATPMSIVGEYDSATVHPNGCGGVEAAGRMFIDSGGGTPSNLYEADLYSFPLAGYASTNPPNTPAPELVFSEDVPHADAHGGTATGRGRYVWVADRGRNLILVSATGGAGLVNRIFLPGPLSTDPTPDLLATSPNGSHVFMTLRGPTPLTADPHVSTGSTPGVGVVKVLAGGRDGLFESIAPMTNRDSSGVEHADPHGLALRVRKP